MPWETQDMRDTLDVREPCDDMLEIGDSGAGDVAIVACALLSGVRIMMFVYRSITITNPEYLRFFDVSSTWHGTALSREPTSVHYMFARYHWLINTNSLLLDITKKKSAAREIYVRNEFLSAFFSLYLQVCLSCNAQKSITWSSNVRNSIDRGSESH